jgi:hypothetical protein
MKIFSVSLSVQSFLFSALSLLLVTPQAKANDPVCDQVASQLKEGDLVFREIHNFIFRYVARTTKSWASHVGLAFKDKHGKWMVGESRVPVVTIRPLCDYFDAGSDRLSVRRLKRELTEAEVSSMRSYITEQIPKFYEFGFNLEQNSRQFCSKLVQEAYAKATGIEVGKRETFGDLMESIRGRPDEAELVRFWNVYFLGEIPYNRVTIVPATQYEDEDFVTVFNSDGVIHFDRNEIFHAGELERGTDVSEFMKKLKLLQRF